MKTGVKLAALAGAALVVDGLGFSAMTASAQERASRQTRDFVQMASESDAFEIAEAQSALAESKDPQVLDFARQMIRDHTRTSQALAQAAMASGLQPPPMAVGAGNAPFLAALQSQRGEKFDQMYWHHQLLGHRAALTVEQQYAQSGDDPGIRQAANGALPIIQHHLAMAEQMVAARPDPDG